MGHLHSIKYIFLYTLFLTMLFIGSLFFYLTILYFEPERFRMPDNCIFYDRNGKILRFIPDQKGERHIWIKGKEIAWFEKQLWLSTAYYHSFCPLIACVRC